MVYGHQYIIATSFQGSGALELKKKMAKEFTDVRRRNSWIRVKAKIRRKNMFEGCYLLFQLFEEYLHGKKHLFRILKLRVWEKGKCFEESLRGCKDVKSLKIFKHLEWIISQLLNLAFVWCEKLCRFSEIEKCFVGIIILKSTLKKHCLAICPCILGCEDGTVHKSI